MVWAVALGAVGGESSGPGVVLGVTLVVVVLFLCQCAASAVRHILERGTVEYRRYGDRLVAYDTWLDEPQWAADTDLLRNVEVLDRRFADRLSDTRTVAVTTGTGDDERERHLGPVADPDRLVETFDLPIVGTDLDPLNRPLVGLALALACAVLVVPPVLAVAPLFDPGVVLAAYLALPFLLTVPWGVWQLAYRVGG